MPRLPQHGDPNWGATLNEFLLVAHRENGSLKGVKTVHNVLDYGVSVESPSAQNTAHFQEAIDAAAGSVLYVPPGEYQVGELLLPSNIVIVGDGPTSILKFIPIMPVAELQRGNLFTNKDWTSGNQNIRIQSLRLVGNREELLRKPDDSTQFFDPEDVRIYHAVNLRGSSYCVLQGLTIKDFVLDGIYLGTSDPNRDPTARGSSNNMVCRNTIIGNGRNGISITRGADNQLLFNYLSQNNKGVIPPEGANTEAYSARPYEAGAIDIEPYGDFEDVSRTRIHGNHLVGNRYNGIQLKLNEAAPWTGIVVSENFIHTSGRHGIAAQHTRHMTVHGNVVSENKEAGIALGQGAGVMNTIVTANQVFDNQGIGILINGERSARGIIANNISYGNGNESYEQGIIVAAGTDMVVTGNISLENFNPEQINVQSENSLYNSNIGRASEIGRFLPAFARTGEALVTTAAAQEVALRHIDADDEDLVWSFRAEDEGVFLSNLTNSDSGSRVVLARDIEPLLERLQQLELAATE